MERGQHRHGRTDPAQGKTQPTSADAMCTPCLEAVGAHYHELQWGLSANAARHLRAQRAARQTLIANPIDPTSGIRQVLARTCTTSTSPSYGLWTVSCTETVGGGTSSTSSRTAFKSIVYKFISDIKADSPATVVDTEKADMKTKTHFSPTQTSKPKWLPATPFGISDHPHSCSIRPLLHHRHQCRLLRHGSRRGEGRHGRQNSFFCLSSLPGI